MSDDIRPVAGSPVELLVVGGLTIDVFDGAQAIGGGARYSTEGALAAGVRVGLVTVAADEPLIRTWVKASAERTDVRWRPTASTIVFEHHGHHAGRRLRLRSQTEPIGARDAGRAPAARAILFAPVASEIANDVLGMFPAAVRAAGLQGWLRRTDADGWVERLRLSDVDPDTAAALRGLDLLLASVDELRGDAGDEGIERLRAWVGPGPELVVTAGAEGAWVDDGRAPARHVPPAALSERHTIGAGDAFAAVIVAGRGAELDLAEAAARASAATARYLDTRPDPPPLGSDS